MAEPLSNPFVGPRPFETGETIFGRDKELAELRYLLTSERIVVLHSPSGAGKSSLVRAGLIPQLSRKFDVWRPTRVNQQPHDRVLNRYAWSAVMGFEQELPEARRRDPASFADQTLAQYFAERPRRPGAPKSVVLIFDQFEEILRVDPLDIAAKTEFFNQLGELLMDSQVWALFALREDYLAPLDPYCRLVPTYLRNRYRIDLLSLDAAKEAISKPAPAGGREFKPDAVDKLVLDLAKVKVQQADLSFAEQTGLSVEPLQLQVVCRRLWDRMPADDMVVDTEDIEQFGNVTTALSDYYGSELAKIAAGDAATERSMRQWMEKKLITPDNIRGQVLRTAGKSEGLDNTLIAGLVDTFLVRAEQRGGSVWYELSHDRLIEPVRQNNEEWRDAHLASWQKTAMLWDANRSQDRLLLGDQELEEVTANVEKGRVKPDAVEMQFIKASREKQQALDRERRNTKVLQAVTRVTAVLGIIAAIACVVAVRAYQQANHLREVASQSLRQAEYERKKDEEREVEAQLAYTSAYTRMAQGKQVHANSRPPNPSPGFGANDPQIFIHIRNPFQRKSANELQKRLVEHSFKVMGIEMLPFGGDGFSLRYFHAADAEAAKKIAALVENGAEVRIDYITRFQGSDKVRPGHIEIWFGPEPVTPIGLRVPNNHIVVMAATTKDGKEVFTCQQERGKFSWKWKETESRLIGEKGDPVGRVSAGPAWVADDGSRVTGGVILASIQPDPPAAPWWLLRTGAQTGVGAFGRVTFIHRVRTQGGLPPKESCDSAAVNTERRVDIEAAYYFYADRPND